MIDKDNTLELSGNEFVKCLDVAFHMLREAKVEKALEQAGLSWDEWMEVMGDFRTLDVNLWVDEGVAHASVYGLKTLSKTKKIVRETNTNVWFKIPDVILRNCEALC